MKSDTALVPTSQTMTVAQVAQVELPPVPSPAPSSLLPAIPIALGVFGGIAALFIVKTTIQICRPNEILILSGRKHRNKKGQEVGYRVIYGGRAFAIPILENVERMDITTMPIVVEVKNVYSKGGTPLNIQAIANVKVSSDPTVAGNAIERFLGRNRSEIARVALETLEGNLRGVVATLTPEQVNEDRLQFADRIAQDVARDLAKLGLQIDTLRIQNVSDNVDYLSSIGRRQIAHIVRDAEIAEAEAVGKADRVEADCHREAEVYKTQALTLIQQKQNELRKIQAELDQQAKSEEARTIAAANEAKARAEQQLQPMRAELAQLRLHAENILPAEADRQAKVLKAQGNAASITENAKATALANDLLSQVWRETNDVSEMLLLQQIDVVLKEAAKIPNRIHLEHINVVDSGNGQSLTNLMNIYYPMVRQFLEQVDQNLGINVAKTLNRQPDAINQSNPSRRDN